MKKLESVRNVSSPVLKLITIQRLMQEIMSAVNGSQTTGPHEADHLINVIFYLLVSLQSNEAKFFGARFIEEVTYIDSFMHEEQIGLIEEYTNIDHMKCVLDTLRKGLRACERIFILQGSEGSSDNSASRSSSSATANILDNQP